LTTPVADGSSVSVHVDGTVFGQSVHAKLACSECHPSAADVPHESRTVGSRRELTLAYDEQCW
jgi:hypothetical protein